MKPSSHRPILVLGAGIQGICIALALRSCGYRVVVIDQMPDLMLRTSLRNEGKVHLGFVYANDLSFQTSELLLRASLRFGPLLDSWLAQPVDWRALSSLPFVYLIARDSMLGADQLRAHYARLQDCLDEMVRAGEKATYLGNNLAGKRLSQSAVSSYSAFSPAHVADIVETQEVALDREALRQLLRKRIAEFPEISFRYNHRIEQIDRTPDGFRVSGVNDEGTRWSEDSPTAINCLWDGRLVLDQQLGYAPRRPFVMRLKYRVLGEIPSSLTALPSITMVLGRYGDIVRYPDAPTYFSWYPACLRGWSANLTPPADWNAACIGEPDPALAAEVAEQTLTAFQEIIPALRGTQPLHVDGGVIFSWGETDIDDPDSALHARYQIGFTHHEGYYSVDTGKFTCAPLFAQQLVDHLADAV